MNKFMQFLKDEEGATAVEYGLIVGLIAAVIVTVVLGLGRQVDAAFTKASKGLTSGGFSSAAPGS